MTQRSKRIGPTKSKALKQSPSEERMTVRLTAPLNDTLRRAALYRGDISKTISDALKNVNLVQVKAIDLEAAGELARSTTIVIDRELFLRLKAASTERGSSMNLLINSALAHKFGQHPPKEKSKS
jgi:BRCT domain type II-containing protein